MEYVDSDAECCTAAFFHLIDHAITCAKKVVHLEIGLLKIGLQHLDTLAGSSFPNLRSLTANGTMSDNLARFIMTHCTKLVTLHLPYATSRGFSMDLDLYGQPSVRSDMGLFPRLKSYLGEGTMLPLVLRGSTADMMSIYFMDGSTFAPCLGFLPSSIRTIILVTAFWLPEGLSIIAHQAPHLEYLEWTKVVMAGAEATDWEIVSLSTCRMHRAQIN